MQLLQHCEKLLAGITSTVELDNLQNPHAHGQSNANLFFGFHLESHDDLPRNNGKHQVENARIRCTTVRDFPGFPSTETETKKKKKKKKTYH